MKLLYGVSAAPRLAAPATAAEDVLGDRDLLECILSGNVGLCTYVLVRQLSRATRDACMENRALLRAVALHSGGLSKREFVGLFSLSYQEGGRYPHSVCGRQHMFSAPAIDQALARPECMLLMRVHATCSRLEREAYLSRRYGCGARHKGGACGGQRGV